MSDGWVKLYRKTQRSNMYKNLNSVQRDVMINCLMLANHKPNKWEWKGQIFEVQPGQFITSLPSLKNVCAKDVSKQNIRTALKKLIKWDFLEQETTKTGRLITIKNWEKYQKDESKTNRQSTDNQSYSGGDDSKKEKETNRQLTDNQQTTNRQLTSNKNVKNDKNDKNVKNKDTIPYAKIVDYLNKKADRNFKPTSQATQRHISGRWNEGFDLEDFKTVIDKKCAEWLNDNEMSKYLRPRTLFGTKFEGYLNQPYPKEGNNGKNKMAGKDRGAAEGSIGKEVEAMFNS